MNPPVVRDSPSDLSDQLVRVLEEYLAAVPVGKQPSRDELLNAHPQLVDELNACLGTLEFIQRAAVDSPSGSSGETGELSGKPLGDFRIIRELGRGGMGVVYEAEQLSVGRRVALKILPFAAVLDKKQLNRFKNEAQAAGQLRHSNIVGVYSVGCERGVHFYAMELVEGQNLADLISEMHCKATGSDARLSDRNRWSSGSGDTQPIAAIATEASTNTPAFFRGVAQLGIQVADALQYAHDMGVIHRDIKPSNLLVDDEGTVWVTDFGLAHIQNDSNLTVSGDLLGTLRYMSTEQVAGGKVLDQRTDVYSLGVTLQELLTGKPAVSGTDRQQIIQKILEDIPTSASELNHRVPRDLKTILLKATAKERDDRYATAAELAADLRRFLEDRPISARRPSRFERTRRWARRNPFVATLLATVIVLLALLSTGSFLVAWRAVKYAEAREAMNYAGDIKLANAAIDQGDSTGAEQILLKWKPEEGEHDLRGFEWDYLWMKGHNGAARSDIRDDFFVSGVAYSEDGTRLAMANIMSRAIRILDSRNGSLIESLTMPANTVLSLIRPHGTNTLVAGDHGGNVAFWDFDSLEQLDTLEVPVGLDERAVHSVAISSDLIAVGVGRSASHGAKSPALVQVWDRAQHRWTRLDGEVGRTHVSLLATDDGDRLITGCFQNAVKVRDVSTWKVVRELPVPFGELTSATATSPDQSLLAIASASPRGGAYDSRIDIWQTRGWKRLHGVMRHQDLVTCLCFSPDGKLLAAGGHDGAMSLIEPLTGRTVFFASAHRHKILDLAFTPDGRFLCTASKQARVWKVSDLLTQRQTDVYLRHDSGRVCGVVFLDEGSTVCTVGPAGDVAVWDARTAHVKRRFDVEHQTANLSSIAVSPNRKWLAVLRRNWPPRKEASTKLELLLLPSFTRKHTVLLPSGYNPAAFSVDSRVLAVPLPTSIVLVDVETGQTLSTLEPIDAPVQCPAFSPDGRLMAVGTGSGNTYIFDFEDLTLIKRIKSDGAYTKAVSFSPDGKYFVTGGSDEQVKYWDARSFRRLPGTGQCTDAVQLTRFSFDGQRLLSASMAGTLRIWKPMLEDELLSLPLPSVLPLCGEFAPDGSSVVSGAGAIAVVFRAADRNDLQRLAIEQLPHFGCDR